MNVFEIAGIGMGVIGGLAVIIGIIQLISLHFTDEEITFYKLSQFFKRTNKKRMFFHKLKNLLITLIPIKKTHVITLNTRESHDSFTYVLKKIKPLNWRFCQFQTTATYETSKRCRKTQLYIEIIFPWLNGDIIILLNYLKNIKNTKIPIEVYSDASSSPEIFDHI